MNTNRNTSKSIVEVKGMPPWLVVGITILPIVFAWFTLKKGFSKQARLVSFGWMILFPMLAVFSKDYQAVEQTMMAFAKEKAGMGADVDAVNDTPEDIADSSEAEAGEEVLIPKARVPLDQVSISGDVYVPYNEETNKEIFEQYGSRIKDIQPLRELMAERVALSGMCENVGLSAVQLNEDVNNLVFVVLCTNKVGEEYSHVQIFATEKELLDLNSFK